MSDFLDRVAARAIGSEATLAPRLPSLFEPLQRAPVMPSVDDAESPPPHATAPELHAAPVVESLRPSHAATALPPESLRPVPVERTVAPMQATATTPSPPASLRPPAVAATRIVERVDVPPSRSPRPVEAAPVQPRQTRVTPERIDTTSPPARGALLPDPAPVFASAHVAPASGRSGNIATNRPPAAPNAIRQHAAPSEPIVHVSIGRLEVRAAPAAAAPPRHRDGPQPGSLDDYLRQRGKVSP